MLMEAIVFDIKKFAVHDGPGIRTTFFFKGCPLRCAWCHNPESFEFGQASSKQVKSIDSLVEIALKDQVYYDESGGGVTISGGEPFSQFPQLKSFLQKLKKNWIHTIVDTSGFAELSQVKEIAELTDIFLYDLKIIDSKNHIKYTKQDNSLIIDNLHELIKLDANIVVRIPLIPDITDIDENVEQIIQFLNAQSRKLPVSLLPFHNYGMHKYEELGLKCLVKELECYSEERFNTIKRKFINAQFELINF
jgi:pyruvate formate lyase activating enzyme